MTVIPAGERLTETEAAKALLEFLKGRAYGEATYRQIWLYMGLPWVRFTTADKNLSKRGEPHWHTVFRNISAHHDKRGNPIHEGLLKKRTGKGGGFQLAGCTGSTSKKDPGLFFIVDAIYRPDDKDDPDHGLFGWFKTETEA